MDDPDLYRAALRTDDTSVCKNDAVPALLRIGSQFANELFDGFSPEFEKYECDVQKDTPRVG